MSIGKHGDVYSWGTDENGSLGHGFKWPTVAAQRPTPVPLRLKSGAAGWKHSAGEGPWVDPAACFKVQDSPHGSDGINN
jgi:hypothetical protein